MRLCPFWRYYGGKFRAAPRYPKPEHGTIVEPFAGAAGYSMRYADRNVVLVEAYPVVAEMWRFLIAATKEEILRIPEVENVDDLPSWVPVGARALVGFSLNSAVVTPCNVLSAGRKNLTLMGRRFEGWCPAQRERVANQVHLVKHWKIIEGDFSKAPNLRATWFVDPPYQEAGKYYPHQVADYSQLAGWCRRRRGQVIVCENVGATWLPFEPFASIKAGPARRVSHEAIWVGGVA